MFLKGLQYLVSLSFGIAPNIKTYIRTGEVINKCLINIAKLFGPVLLICSFNCHENPDISSYYTMVAKDTFEPAYKER